MLSLIEPIFCRTLHSCTDFDLCAFFFSLFFSCKYFLLDKFLKNLVHGRAVQISVPEIRTCTAEIFSRWVILECLFQLFSALLNTKCWQQFIYYSTLLHKQTKHRHHFHNIMVVEFNNNNPPCPQCNILCDDSYRCRECGCNMHGFYCLIVAMNL